MYDYINYRYAFSSLAARPFSSSALSRRIVPLVSVSRNSIGQLKTAILQFYILFTAPRGTTGTTIPVSTKEASMLLPYILATRTKSALKFPSFYIYRTALEIRLHIKSSFPFYLELTADRIQRFKPASVDASIDPQRSVFI